MRAATVHISIHFIKTSCQVFSSISPFPDFESVLMNFSQSVSLHEKSVSVSCLCLCWWWCHFLPITRYTQNQITCLHSLSWEVDKMSSLVHPPPQNLPSDTVTRQESCATWLTSASVPRLRHFTAKKDFKNSLSLNSSKIMQHRGEKLFSAAVFHWYLNT